MELSVKTIVIIIIGLIVMTVALLFAFGILSKGGDQTNSFWFFSSNITKKTSEDAGKSHEITGNCQNTGETCFGQNSDCCQGSGNPIVCRPYSFDGDLFCVECSSGTLNPSTGTESGDFCESNSDCCSGQTCKNAMTQNAYCCCE